MKKLTSFSDSGHRFPLEEPTFYFTAKSCWLVLSAFSESGWIQCLHSRRNYLSIPVLQMKAHKTCWYAGVPLATEPGISLIILTPMKILQRNLNRSTSVVWEMKRNVSVVCVCFVAISSFVLELLKKCRDSLASGTPCIYNMKSNKCNCVPYKNIFQLGRDTSVGTATSYGLDGPGIESRWGRDFLHPSRTALCPSQPPVQWIPGLYRR